jgi:serine protease Do
MKPTKKLIIIAVLFISIGLIIGLGISTNLDTFTRGYTQDFKISKDSIETLSKINQAMSEISASVKPSVVGVTSTKTVHMQGMPSPFSEDPFFRQFFGGLDRGSRPRDYKQSGLGSGVIVAKDGYILTNNHVIKDADDIKVRLSDKRVFKGKVIGADQKTDLAVIKIDVDGLPVLKIGDSQQLKVGETVIAVGNPFGLTQTVTSGIISAKGRADVGIADYEDFIQTDAPINPGNSGGALVNIQGELIGINTAIVSSSGGYEGIGFAIPTSMAKVVMESLIKHGKVVRGWLGVSIQPVTPELAKQLGLKSERGALVADVAEGGPAAKAGFKSGDVVTGFDGKEVPDAVALRNLVAGTAPGKEIKITFYRNGSEQTVMVTIREATAQQEQKMIGRAENQFKGVSVQNLTAELRNNLGIPRRVTGAVVADVASDSPAADVLTQGDVIMEINRKKISDVRDYQAALGMIKSGETALVLIYRNGMSLFITF